MKIAKVTRCLFVERFFLNSFENKIDYFYELLVKFEDGLCGFHRDPQGTPPKNQNLNNFLSGGLIFDLVMSIDRAHQDLNLTLFLSITP